MRIGGNGNTSNDIIGQNTYLLPGLYTVTVEFTTAKGSYTRSKSITVIQNPVANPIPNTYLCGVQTMLTTLMLSIVTSRKSNTWQLFYSLF